MAHLPTLKWKPAPPGRAERLARWFAEWNLVQKLQRENPEFAEPLRPNRGQSDMPCPDPAPPVAPFDPELAKGQIRLMDPLLFAEFQRPIYVALIAEWGPNSFLTAPFGPFLEPATKTEWLTGHRENSLRVLCLWNVRTMSTDVLQRSWHVDDLAAQELQDAWQVFRHATTGADLEDRLLAQVGCPIVHPRDSRLAYQQEEASLLASLALPVVAEAPVPAAKPQPVSVALAQALEELLEKLTAVIRPVFGAEALAALAAASGEEEELKEVWDSKHDLDPLRCIVYREGDGDLLLHFSSTNDAHENRTFEVVVKEQTRPTVTFRRNPQGRLFGEARIPRDELPEADLSKLTFRLKKS
ncbi:MAG: hypothetical protein NT154_30745 [Verrucomicrobia bacterium]|nr:hypothetical protein [Verrucomicrobiota bacterium]